MADLNYDFDGTESASASENNFDTSGSTASDANFNVSAGIKVDYPLDVLNKPSINGNELVGDKSSAELGIIDKTVSDLDNYTTTSALNTALGLKQDKTDNSLNTTSKTIVGAINEVDSLISSETDARILADQTILDSIKNTTRTNSYYTSSSTLTEVKPSGSGVLLNAIPTNLGTVETLLWEFTDTIPAGFYLDKDNTYESQFLLRNLMANKSYLLRVEVFAVDTVTSNVTMVINRTIPTISGVTTFDYYGSSINEQPDNITFTNDQIRHIKIYGRVSNGLDGQISALVDTPNAYFTRVERGGVVSAGSVETIIDGVVKTQQEFNEEVVLDLSNKLDVDGDSKDNTTTFTVPTTPDEPENIISTEKHSTMFGKIARFLSSLNILKQNITDNSLTTTNKTVVGAVNEVNANKKEYPKLVCDYTVTNNIVIQPISLDYATGIFTTDVILPASLSNYLGYFLNDTNIDVNSVNVIPAEIQNETGLTRFKRIDDYHFRIAHLDVEKTSFTSTAYTDVTKFHFENVKGFTITGLNLSNNFRILINGRSQHTCSIRLNSLTNCFIGSSDPMNDLDISDISYNGSAKGLPFQSDISVKIINNIYMYTKIYSYFTITNNKIVSSSSGVGHGFSTKSISEIGAITNIFFREYAGGYANGTNIKIYDYGENLC